MIKRNIAFVPFRRRLDSELWRIASARLGQAKRASDPREAGTQGLRAVGPHPQQGLETPEVSRRTHGQLDNHCT
jgi:hypothetical protein